MTLEGRLGELSCRIDADKFDVIIAIKVFTYMLE